MSKELTKYSFQNLVERGTIRIPQIQRDYAQGRLGDKVKEIRKVFVHTLMLVVKGKRPTTELDFVYGSQENNAFEPLDGQQRLTTLFLLYWMMGVDLKDSKDPRHAIFSYETRNTSKEFCDELVQHEALQFVTEAQEKQIRLKKDFTPSKVIKGRDWFKWEWKYDPTVLSMLVMIDAIYEEMGDDWSMDLNICRDNLQRITFNLLDLGEFGLSNELFIKMNARGKQLSDFDKLKSTLEEELQLQQKEKNSKGEFLACTQDEANWRMLMDGAWIDFFWHKYARERIFQTEYDLENNEINRLDAAKLAERQFKKLLLRLIALQIFEKNPSNSNLCEAAYQLEESKIDDLISKYTDSLVELRSDDQHCIVPDDLVTISFPKLIDDLNSLLFKEQDIFYEFSYLFSRESHIENNELSLLDSFLEVKVPNDTELIFYGMLLFLRKFPAQKTKKNESDSFAWYFDRNQHKVWLTNLENWVRILRNILLNDNNNQRIDKILYALEATQSLKLMSDDLVEFVRIEDTDMEIDDMLVYRFFGSLNLEQKSYQRLDNQSLNEEKRKALLRLKDSAWNRTLDEAERHPYLWGQIRCLLNWSNENLISFNAYSESVRTLLNFIDENKLKYYTAMLAFMPDSWKSSNRLFQYNKDRDNSFKRYLREHTKEDQAYGESLKAFIDYWKSEFTDLSLDQAVDIILTVKYEEAPIWVQCIIEYPEILEESWNKRLYLDKGHVVLAQRKTMDSHCFDPILVYLREFCKTQGKMETEYKLYDSKANDYVHAFEYWKGENKYLVKWAEEDENGLYTVSCNDEPESNLMAPDKAVQYMKSLIEDSPN